MVPSPITEDFYIALGITQTATPQEVIQSYRRLALKLHPDRNPRPDATQAFQLLSRAYETLKDEDKRRDYNLIYPAIRQKHASAKSKQTSRPPPATNSQAEASSEAAQIAALKKSKLERTQRWQIKKNALETCISETQRHVRRLEQEIKNLDSLRAAEAAEETKKNSWGTWLLSPIYRQKEDTAEEKARKDIERQERRMEKDMKERRLAVKKAELQDEDNRLKKAKEEADSAIRVDEQKIQVIEDRIKAREVRTRLEKERAEQARRAQFHKQQQEEKEKYEREAAKAREKMQAARRAAEEERVKELRARQEKERAEQAKRAKVQRQQQEEQHKRYSEAMQARRAAEEKRQEQEAKRQQELYDDQRKRAQGHYSFSAQSIPRMHSSNNTSCFHEGWWEKVQGLAPCPDCQDVWKYLLECPTCPKQACPKCQSIIRGNMSRGAAKLPRREPPKRRSPSPDYYGDYL